MNFSKKSYRGRHDILLTVSKKWEARENFNSGAPNEEIRAKYLFSGPFSYTLNDIFISLKTTGVKKFTKTQHLSLLPNKH